MKSARLFLKLFLWSLTVSGTLPSGLESSDSGGLKFEIGDTSRRLSREATSDLVHSLLSRTNYGSSFNPSETLELVRKLLKDEDGNLVNENIRKKFQDVSDSCKVEISKCNSQYFDHVKLQLFIHKEQPTMRELWRFCKRRMFEFCKQQPKSFYYQLMRVRTSSTIQEDEWNLLTRLHELIFGKITFIPTSTMIDQLIRKVEPLFIRFAVDLTNKIAFGLPNQDEVLKDVMSNIKGLCARVTLALEEPMSYYYHTMHDRELQGHMSGLEFDTVVTNEMCKLLIKVTKSYLDESGTTSSTHRPSLPSTNLTKILDLSASISKEDDRIGNSKYEIMTRECLDITHFNLRLKCLQELSRKTLDIPISERKYLNNMIEFCTLDKRKCTGNFFRSFEIGIDMIELLGQTMKPELEHCRQELFAYCKRSPLNPVKQLHSAAARLMYPVRVIVEEAKREFAKFSRKRNTISRNYWINYLKHQGDERADMICSNIDESFYEVMGFYEYRLRDISEMSGVGRFEMDYINIWAVCKEIIENKAMVELKKLRSFVKNQLDDIDALDNEIAQLGFLTHREAQGFSSATEPSSSGFTGRFGQFGAPMTNPYSGMPIIGSRHGKNPVIDPDNDMDKLEDCFNLPVEIQYTCLYNLASTRLNLPQKEMENFQLLLHICDTRPSKCTGTHFRLFSKNMGKLKVAGRDTSQLLRLSRIRLFNICQRSHPSPIYQLQMAVSKIDPSYRDIVMKTLKAFSTIKGNCRNTKCKQVWFEELVKSGSQLQICRSLNHILYEVMGLYEHTIGTREFGSSVSREEREWINIWQICRDLLQV